MLSAMDFELSLFPLYLSKVSARADRSSLGKPQHVMSKGTEGRDLVWFMFRPERKKMVWP